MKTFLVKYLILLAVGLGAIVVDLGSFWCNIATAILGLFVLIIMAKIAKHDEPFQNWLDNN